MENIIEYSATDTQRTLLRIEKSVLEKSSAEVRSILGNASKTFDENGMQQYFREAQALVLRREWQENDMPLAHSFVLYHIYLMFYRDIRSDECRDFLNRIRNLYLQGKTPFQ